MRTKRWDDAELQRYRLDGEALVYKVACRPRDVAEALLERVAFLRGAPENAGSARVGMVWVWGAAAWGADPIVCAGYDPEAADAAKELAALLAEVPAGTCWEREARLRARASAPPPVVDAEAAAYDNAARSGTAAAWGTFLELYPSGPYAGAARAALAKVEPKASPAPAAPRPASTSGPHSGADWAQDAVVGWMRRVPRGTFKMGSPTSEPGRYDDEGPQHLVTVSEFWLMESEVTQRMWLDVMGSNPSEHRGCLDCPVEQVSWDDAQAFITKLNARTGRTFRLPTEAEWEYAARGNKAYIYAGASDLGSVAWFGDNAGDETHQVCGKPRNGFGLCDMSGNVWEWCLDGKRTYTPVAVTDPRGPTEAGSNRVTRGGSWVGSALNLRVAYRVRWSQSYRDAYLGLRLARSE